MQTISQQLTDNGASVNVVKAIQNDMITAVRNIKVLFLNLIIISITLGFLEQRKTDAKTIRRVVQWTGKSSQRSNERTSEETRNPKEP